MHPPWCRKIGKLRYRNETYDYVYDREGSLLALLEKGVLAGMVDDETTARIAEFLDENYRDSLIRHVGFGMILDLFFEYEIKDDILYLHRIYLRYHPKKKALVLDKKATWKERITVKTPQGYKTYFHFNEARLVKIEETREKCISFGDRIKQYIEG